MAGAKVTSLKGVQKLVKKAGGREGVQVVIGAVLKRLCDASAMCRILTEKAEEKHWVVAGLPKLQPLVPVAQAVNNASRRVIYLHNILDTGVICNSRKQRNKVRKTAMKLREAAEDLIGINIKPVKDLGDSLNEIAEDVLQDRKVRAQIRPNIVKAHFDQLHDLAKAREECAKVYNSKMKLYTD